MTNRLLYYPLINIPNREWFNVALLYWDHVATIAPSEFGSPRNRSTNEHFDPHMSDLVEHGLVNTIDPEPFVHRIGGFEATFLARLEELLTAGTIKRGKDAHLTNVSTLRLHSAKTTDGILDFLDRNRLARSANDEWFQVETKTADLYMTYLAVTLSSLPEIDRTPITDSQRRFNTLRLLPEQSLSIYQPDQEEAVRMVLLKEALPVPTRGITAANLRTFKDAHNPQLANFRRFVNNAISEIAQAKDPRAKIEEYKDRIRQERQLLIARMRPLGWRAFRSTPLVALTSLGPIAGGVIDQVATLGLGVSAGTGLIAGLVQLGTASRLAIRKRLDDPTAPLAYAALVETTFSRR